jgi:hypothetical protein
VTLLLFCAIARSSSSFPPHFSNPPFWPISFSCLWHPKHISLDCVLALQVKLPQVFPQNIWHSWVTLVRRFLDSSGFFSLAPHYHMHRSSLLQFSPFSPACLHACIPWVQSLEPCLASSRWSIPFGGVRDPYLLYSSILSLHMCFSAFSLTPISQALLILWDWLITYLISTDKENTDKNNQHLLSTCNILGTVLSILRVISHWVFSTLKVSPIITHTLQKENWGKEW